MDGRLVFFAVPFIFMFIVILVMLSRFRKCPSDQIMVIYGKTGDGDRPICVHGGTKLVWPLIQSCGYISLHPMQLEVNLDNGLCKENIPVSLKGVFTVGVSTQPEIMANAAERLLGMSRDAIEDLARNTINGSLRQVMASMTIEKVDSEREVFLQAAEKDLAEKLKKIGFELLNMNITGITGKSG